MCIFLDSEYLFLIHPLNVFGSKYLYIYIFFSVMFFFLSWRSLTTFLQQKSLQKFFILVGTSLAFPSFTILCKRSCLNLIGCRHDLGFIQWNNSIS